MTEVELVNSFDARVWADEFARIWPQYGSDKELMIGWFANAIMCGHDHAVRRAEKELHEFLGWLSGDIKELHAVECPRLLDSLQRFRSLS